MESVIDHHVLDAALKRCGATWDAAQTHGLLSGRLAIAGSESGFEWLDSNGWGDWCPYWKPEGGGRPSAKFIVNPRVFDQ